MEAVAFVQMLHKSISRSKTGAKRHILKMTNAADYRTVAKTIRETKGLYKRLKLVQALPSIHAFVYFGKLSPSLTKRFPGLVRFEEDISLSVHGIPASYLSPIASEPKSRFKKPYVPHGIRSLRIPTVWRHSLGEKVKIGIIDTGVDYHHPDLQPVLAKGINLVNARTLPYDDNGHGTHIAGTIAATGRHWMSGIAPMATLYPVKAFDHNGSAYVSDIIKAIDWCVWNGVDIINMSFGMKKRSEAMLEAVRNAHQAGVVIVASSGNDGRRGFIDYPARFPQTISVGAVNRRGAIASFSNRGRRIDVFAPGENIVSTWPNRRFREMNGTSMATSHVTGILALLLSVRPNLSPLQLKRIVAKAQLPLKGNAKMARIPGRIDAVRAFRTLP